MNNQLIDFVENNLVIKKGNSVSLFVCLTLSIVMVAGSTITMNVFAQTQTQTQTQTRTQTLPTCTDPTSQNLPKL